MITRRSFNAGLVVATGVSLLDRVSPQSSDLGVLPLWVPGELDIHHIDTGRGNATFLLCPDGTTLLIDCGTTDDSLEVSAPFRPNDSRRPGEWVARYVLHHATAAKRDRLDYLIATHVHPDHVGDIPPGIPAQADGVIPTGVSQLEEFLPIEKVIDRSFPDYGAFVPPKAPWAANYLAWLRARIRKGRVVEAARVGSADQVGLRHPNVFPGFSIRILSANARVWTGTGDNSRSCFPDPDSISKADWPNENCFSIAVKLTYGKFSWFSGADLIAETMDGRVPWMDIETPVVRVAGRVEVAMADHHGYYDACGPEFTKSLNAQAYVIPAWHVTHPGQAQLQRMLDAWPGAKLQEVHSLEMLPANRLLNAFRLKQMRSTQGHVVVRVAPGGASYRIYVVDSTREDGSIWYRSQTYLSRG